MLAISDWPRSPTRRTIPPRAWLEHEPRSDYEDVCVAQVVEAAQRHGVKRITYVLGTSGLVYGNAAALRKNDRVIVFGKPSLRWHFASVQGFAQMVAEADDLFLESNEPFSGRILHYGCGQFYPARRERP